MGKQCICCLPIFSYNLSFPLQYAPSSKRGGGERRKKIATIDQTQKVFRTEPDVATLTTAATRQVVTSRHTAPQHVISAEKLMSDIYFLFRVQSSRKMRLCLSCSCDPLEGDFPYNIVTWQDLCILCICYCSFCVGGICWGADKCARKTGLVRSRSGSKSRSKSSRRPHKPQSDQQSQQQS
ncbi:uncharacterized protein BDW70DRAFT_139638 [Aspergillus foveolatus]|uniref:uncharacterized protein n=1 Tax=Aspergillus foveolatus TaxID=210207 RepID=UPI003CCE3532